METRHLYRIFTGPSFAVGADISYVVRFLGKIRFKHKKTVSQDFSHKYFSGPSDVLDNCECGNYSAVQ